MQGSDAAAIERDTAHRPWPMPGGAWVMFQSWRELLFAHWRVPFALLRPLVPSQLELETFDGSAWLGQTPFRLTDLRPRALPPAPFVSEFPEMNLRTYVRYGGIPGIFFFSLDAGSGVAVAAARAFFRLPYFKAEMNIAHEGEWFRYSSSRDGADARFAGRYRPDGEVFHAQTGTLEHFLAERYALFVALRNGNVLRGDIHHRAWPLQPAVAEIEVNTVPAAHAIHELGEGPLLHYAARQDTLIWPPKLVS